MNQVQAIAIIFVVIATYGVLTEGLQCWIGRNGEPTARFRTRSECRGSCFKIDCGHKCVQYGCSEVKMPTKCDKCTHVKRKCCYCNTPLCNTGKVRYNDLLLSNDVLRSNDEGLLRSDDVLRSKDELRPSEELQYNDGQRSKDGRRSKDGLRSSEELLANNVPRSSDAMRFLNIDDMN